MDDDKRIRKLEKIANSIQARLDTLEADVKRLKSGYASPSDYSPGGYFSMNAPVPKIHKGPLNINEIMCAHPDD